MKTVRDLSRKLRNYLPAVLVTCLTTLLSAQETVPGTKPLELSGDLSAQMVEGIDRFLLREIEQSIERRAALWQRDFSSREAYEKSVTPNRERLRTYIGAIDMRLPAADVEVVSTLAAAGKVAETPDYAVFAVRWRVFEGVFGEGLLLRPKKAPVAMVIVLPDADQTPEMVAGLSPGIPIGSQLARRLVEQGCEVIVPVLIDRQDTWSGNSRLNRLTNQPHREWIYRQAYEMGRHIVGYEVQKVLALVDWHAAQNKKLKIQNALGLAGYGEGGLIAFYAAALDPRIDAAWVSGYFQSRQNVWAEPIYRNVFGLLHEFGDAEIASLIMPRPLLVEHSEVPKIDGPPPARSGRHGAAPGKLVTPDQWLVESEVKRLEKFFPKSAKVQPAARLFNGSEGTPEPPGSTLPLLEFLRALGQKIDAPAESRPLPSVTLPLPISIAERQHRQIKELEAYTQELMRRSEEVRANFFWKRLKTGATNEARTALQSNLWEEVIGRFPAPSGLANPRSRKSYEGPSWTGYDVMLDVWPDVYAWGVLLLPKDLKPGERRPVVVCQHGLEGVPADTINTDTNNPGYRYYKGFSARLAERGFVVFAPHNPYRGQDKFRVLQRKANPLKKSLFSVILGQHERILEWLAAQPFVDPDRIGFYGLSYGGKTAMRVPALLNRYALSICSADFNEWIKKNVTVDSNYSYMFTGEYEMPEFNLGPTFNYAEMAALIAPRPFMVERGHNDGVAPDEWVAYEYARVRRYYSEIGLSDRTEIEFFAGPHTINGVGTFRFLEQHLGVKSLKR